MNRAKWVLAVAVVAIALLGVWSWNLRGDDRSEFAAPAPVSRAAESRVEAEPKLATKGVEEPRQAARASESTRETTAKSSSASHDFIVRGHVFVRGTRVPIAGADVALCEPGADSIVDSEDEPFARAISDEQGAYEIPLPGGAPREFALLATHDDFAPTWQDQLPGDAGDLEFDVELDTHFFVGVDVWAPGGRAPVFAADVRLSTATPAFSEAWLQDITDERGHCEFEVTGLPRKDLELIVAADGCAPWMVRNLRLEPGVKRINLTCNLEPPRRVRGRVIDALRKQPIADAELEIVGRRDDFDSGGGEARSDANGEFELELKGCPVEFASVYARAKGYRAARFDQLEHNVELVIELGAPAKLRGTLRVSDGQPLDGATIEIAPSGLWVDASDVVALGTDGAFELQLDEVPYGLARLTCEAQGCVTKALDIIATDTGAGALDITLERALHLHGRVLRASDSRPVSDVRVRLLGANGASAITFSNAAGQYDFYAAPKDVVGARLMVELGGERLAVSQLPVVKDPLELVHDITVALVAPSKPR
jgi:hypothetical protein